MTRTRLSSKGQIVLPKEVRERQGWTVGTEFEVEPKGDVVVLRPTAEPLFPPTTIEEVRGCAGYTGPRVSLEEMDAAVEEEARRMWEEFERQPR